MSNKRFQKGNKIGFESRFKEGKENPNWRDGVGMLSHAELRKKVFIAYGGKNPKCKKCGCDIYDVLSIDHINNKGGEQRKKLFGGQRGSATKLYRWLIRNKFPNGFQILCRNCNHLKYLKFKRGKEEN